MLAASQRTRRVLQSKPRNTQNKPDRATGTFSHTRYFGVKVIAFSKTGYVLRPRLKPRRVPSWLGTNRDPDFCEGSIRPMLCTGNHPYCGLLRKSCLEFVEDQSHRCNARIRWHSLDDQIGIAHQQRNPHYSPSIIERAIS